MKTLIVGLLLPFLSVGVANATPNPISALTTPAPSSGAVCWLVDALGSRAISSVTTLPANCPVVGNPAVLHGVHAALSAGFQVYGAACFALVGFIFTWWWFVSLISGASSGTVSHSKINPVWAPLRFSLGMTMLAPVAAGGLATVQMVVLWLAVQGVGIADNLAQVSTKAFVSGLSSGPPPKASMQAAMGFDADLLQMLACKEYFAAEASAVKAIPAANGSYMLAFEDSRPSGSAPALGAAWGSVPYTSGGVTDYAFDVATGGGGGPGYFMTQPAGCGAFEITGISGQSSSQTLGTYGQSLARTIYQAQTNYVEQEAQELKPLAHELAYGFVNPTKSGQGASDNLTVEQGQQAVAAAQSLVTALRTKYAGILWTEALAYETAIDSAVSTGGQSPEIQALTDSVSKEGWTGLGSYFFTLATAQRMALSAVQAIPTVTQRPGPWDGLDPAMAEEMTYLAEIVADYIKTYAEATPNGQTTGAGTTQGPGSGAQPSSFSPSGFLLSGIETALDPAGGVGGFGKMIRVGGFFETTGEMLIGAKVGASLIPGAAVVIPDVGPLLLAFKKLFDNGLVKTIGVTCVVLGLMMDTILPNLPTVFWALFIVGWIALVLEALIAAPVWAVAHSLPEGEGISGTSARKGYSLLLNVIFRPVLGVFGLWITLVMIELSLDLVFSMYLPVAESVIASNKIAIFDFLTISLVFFLLAGVLVLKAAELVTLVPSKVLGWIAPPGDDGMSTAGVAGQVVSTVRNITTGGWSALASVGRGRGGGGGEGQGPKPGQKPDERQV